MARFHAVWAVLFVAIFLVTGQYMERTFPEAYQGDATMRMIFRSAHIYLLLSALINGAYAINLVPCIGWRRWVQIASSIAIAASPVIFLCAFFFEPAPGRLIRPITLTGVIPALAGVVFGSLASFRGKTTR